MRLYCLEVGRGTHVASEVKDILVFVKVLVYGCRGGFTMVHECRIKPSLRVASRLALSDSGPGFSVSRVRSPYPRPAAVSSQRLRRLG